MNGAKSASPMVQSLPSVSPAGIAVSGRQKRQKYFVSMTSQGRHSAPCSEARALARTLRERLRLGLAQPLGGTVPGTSADRDAYRRATSDRSCGRAGCRSPQLSPPRRSPALTRDLRAPAENRRGTGELRVRGPDGLRVVDASVIPRPRSRADRHDRRRTRRRWQPSSNHLLLRTRPSTNQLQGPTGHVVSDQPARLLSQRQVPQSMQFTRRLLGLVYTASKSCVRRPHFRPTYPLELSKLRVEHRPVNTRPQGRLRQRRARTRRFSRNRCLGGWVDDHCVAEVFELGDQPSGMGFVVASAVPIGAQVVVRLVAFQHPVGRNQDGVRDRDLSRPMPRRFVNRACWTAR